MNKDITPKDVFIFFLNAGVILLLLMAWIPEQGFTLLGRKIYFATFSDFGWGTTNLSKTPSSVTDSLQHSGAPDSIALQPAEIKKRPLLLYSGKVSPLAGFYEITTKGNPIKGTIRVIHYGDSQIENDRISSYLRERWQSLIGGGGMGYLPANAWIPHLSATHSNSDNWMRYTAFGRSHPDITHRRFGPFQSFARFTPADTALCHSVQNAWIEVSASNRGFKNTLHYNQLKVWLGNNAMDFEIAVSQNGTLLQHFLIPPLLEKDTALLIPLNEMGSTVRLEFSARHSPDVYGISLESSTGLVLDNVPMRGADGTSFARTDLKQLAHFFKKEKTALIILQFGGNAVPYLKDREAAGRSAANIARQVRLLRKLSENTPILFIGPSDMSVKVRDAFVTHPLLSDYRDSLILHITSAGAAYYDLMEAMGGEGSMVRWVTSDPPLAATDYIHFTPAGARLAAEKLYEILESDRMQHLKNRKRKPEPPNHTHSVNEPGI
jgi:lysophospholipase L1-like esterase